MVTAAASATSNPIRSASPQLLLGPPAEFTFGRAAPAAARLPPPNVTCPDDECGAEVTGADPGVDPVVALPVPELATIVGVVAPIGAGAADDTAASGNGTPSPSSPSP